MRALRLFAVLATAIAATVAPVGAQEAPFFNARPDADRIDGHAWTANADITVTIDSDGDLGNGFLYTVAVTTDAVGNFGVDLAGSVDLLAGHVVTVSDGSTTKTTVVTVLAVTAIDVDLDTVTGMATPGADVNVGLHDQPAVQRHEVAGPDGSWTADFSVAGDEGFETATGDVAPGRPGGFAWEADTDNDRTEVHWRVVHPVLHAYPGEDAVNGFDWTPNAALEVTVDDDLDLGNGVLGVEPGWADPSGHFWIEVNLDLVPGHVVTVTDGATTKVHTVTSLTVTDVDPDLDTVSGLATPGAQVGLLVFGTNAFRTEVSDPVTGEWTANFAAPGDEPGEESTADIVMGTNGNVREGDGDGDTTTLDWHPLSPAFDARTDSDAINGWDWTANATVDITVDDDGDPGNGTLHVENGVPTGSAGNVWAELGYAVDLVPGLVVTVTDGKTVKVHVITPLVVTSVDTASDTVSGIANPGGEVWVGVDTMPGFVSRHLFADGEGNWTADFSVPGDEEFEDAIADLVLGSEGEVSERDEDGDFTAFRWWLPNPTFTVHPDYWPEISDVVDGWGWSPNATVDVIVDDDEDPANGVLHTVTGAPTDDWGSFWAELGDHDLLAGEVVTVTDGVSTKIHTVTDLVVTGVDAVADTVSGTAQPAVDVNVEVYDGSGAWRHVVADATTGEWTANFSTPGDEDGEDVVTDLVPGTQGNANQHDEDGDATVLDWRLPNPAFTVQPPFDVWSTGDGWTEGATVTLTIDDPSIVGLEYSDFALIERWGPSPWDVGFYFRTEPFVVLDGFEVTVDDGATAKTLTVADFDHTLDEDTVSIAGTGPAGAPISVSFGPAYRSATIDPAGSWGFDLGTEPDPSVGGGSIPHFGAAMDGNAQVFDDDGDSTQQSWRSASIHVYPTDDRLALIDFAPGEVTVTVNDVAMSPTPVVDDSGDFTVYFGLDIEPGDVVVAEQQPWTAEVVVALLEITDVNPDTGVVAGVGTDGARVEVGAWTPEGGYAQRVAYPVGEAWSVDFSTAAGPDDWQQVIALDPGTSLAAFIYDDVDLPENDATVHEWYIATGNQPPTITDVTGPLDPVSLGMSAAVAADFVDPDVGDTHTAVFDWGDGTSSAGVITGADGGGTAEGTHTYLEPGVYAVTVTVTDGLGDSDGAAFEYVVVYDPDGGFVTGSGWIDSPAGAYTAEPALTGPASFGFVSRYKKGASTPTGNTEFRFAVAGLTFRSTSYDWLVVTGSTTARFKGIGSIDSVGGYRFMVWAQDGSPDTFRIRIWTEDATGHEAVIYDNGSDQPLGAGSIVIHTKRK